MRCSDLLRGVLHAGVDPDHGGAASMTSIARIAFANVWESVRPTHIENWPRELRQVSIPSIGIRLTTDETIALGKNQMDWWETWTTKGSEAMPDIRPIGDRIERAFEVVPAPVFVKLGSRAPKDTMAFGKPACDVRAVLDQLLDASERINDDLHMAIAHDYTPWIWLREWWDIPRWSEFRCFVWERRLVGISQYWYDRPFPEICAVPVEFKRVITTFVDHEVIPCLHMDSAVVDVLMRWDRCSPWKLTLLELNPFTKHTDPCLFDWGDIDGFDGGFRFLGQDRREVV